jgi:endonuclease G
MPDFSEEEMAHAERVLNRVRSQWLQRPGVTAVDLGFKWSHGQMTGQLAIRVHVAEKKAPSELSQEELFPEEVEGVPVDVIEATYGIQLMPEGYQLEAATEGRDQRFDDIPLGVSVGSPHVTAGTLGAKVYDLDDDREMILSNWHVLVGHPDADVNLPVWQPGSADGADSNSGIGRLTRWVLSPYDAAVARLTGARPVQARTLEGERIEDATEPRLGMQIWKSGRTTGRTEGFIDGVKMTVSIDYRLAGVQQLREVFHIVPRPGAGQVEISMGGDSGSVWVEQESGKVVGLHFAGEVGGAPEYALAHDITAVIEELRVRFPGQRATTIAEPPPPLSLWQRIWHYLRGLF